MKTSIESIAKLKLKRDHENIKTYGFTGALCDFILHNECSLFGECSDCDSDCNKDFKKNAIREEIDEIFNRRPDAFHICYFCNVVIVYEIEDTSKLTEEKLRDYVELWFYLDTLSDGIEFHLYITDRYGITKTEVPLQQYFYVFLEKRNN